MLSNPAPARFPKSESGTALIPLRCPACLPCTFNIVCHTVSCLSKRAADQVSSLVDRIIYIIIIAGVCALYVRPVYGGLRACRQGRWPHGPTCGAHKTGGWQMEQLFSLAGRRWPVALDCSIKTLTTVSGTSKPHIFMMQNRILICSWKQ